VNRYLTYHKKRFFISFLLFLNSFFSIPGQEARATVATGPQPLPQIYDLTVTNSEHNLLAYFSLKHAITPEISDALKSGIPVKYTYVLELLTPGFLGKKVLLRKEIVRILSFDNLKGEYGVIIYGPIVTRVVNVKGIAEARQLAFQVNDVQVIPLSKLAKGRQYILRVRAEAEKVRGTLPFEELLELFSSWGFKTRWYEIRFSY